VKHEAPKSDEEVAIVGDLEDLIMTVSATALDTLPGSVPEHEICEGVDYFGGIVRGIVVLLCWSVDWSDMKVKESKAYLFAPLQCGRDGLPEARLVRRRVGYSWQP